MKRIFCVVMAVLLACSLAGCAMPNMAYLSRKPKAMAKGPYECSGLVGGRFDGAQYDTGNCSIVRYFLEVTGTQAVLELRESYYESSTSITDDILYLTGNVTENEDKTLSIAFTKAEQETKQTGIQGTFWEGIADMFLGSIRVEADTIETPYDSSVGIGMDGEFGWADISDGTIHEGDYEEENEEEFQSRHEVELKATGYDAVKVQIDKGKNVFLLLEETVNENFVDHLGTTLSFGISSGSNILVYGPDGSISNGIHTGMGFGGGTIIGGNLDYYMQDGVIVDGNGNKLEGVIVDGLEMEDILSAARPKAVRRVYTYHNTGFIQTIRSFDKNDEEIGCIRFNEDSFKFTGEYPTYDDEGRVIRTDEYDGGVINGLYKLYTYENGLVVKEELYGPAYEVQEDKSVTKSEALVKTTTYRYDDQNRVVGTVEKQNGTTVEREYYVYDTEDESAAQTKIEIWYNSKGLKEYEQRFEKNGNTNQLTNYFYNEKDELNWYRITHYENGAPVDSEAYTAAGEPYNDSHHEEDTYYDNGKKEWAYTYNAQGFLTDKKHYSESGKLKEEYIYIDETKGDYTTREYDDSGWLERESKYVNHSPDTIVEYDQDGGKSVCEYRDGQNYKQTVYTKDKKIKTYTTYEHMNDGGVISTTYDAYDRKISEYTYREDQSISREYIYFQDSDTLLYVAEVVGEGKTRYFDGDGNPLDENELPIIYSDVYYENGNPWILYDYYENGVLKKEKQYYENGNLAWECEYSKDGKPVTKTEYYESGVLSSIQVYAKNGVDSTKYGYAENGGRSREYWLYAVDTYKDDAPEYYFHFTEKGILTQRCGYNKKNGFFTYSREFSEEGYVKELEEYDITDDSTFWDRSTLKNTIQYNEGNRPAEHVEYTYYENGCVHTLCLRGDDGETILAIEFKESGRAIEK